MQSSFSFILDGTIVTIDAGSGLPPTTTVLEYLRASAVHKGVKEGCAEGDLCAQMFHQAREHRSFVRSGGGNRDKNFHCEDSDTPWYRG